MPVAEPRTIPIVWRPVLVFILLGLALIFNFVVLITYCLTLFGSAFPTTLAPIIGGATAGLLGLLGVCTSGFIGLQVLRRDRAESEAREIRSLKAGISGECEDIAGIFEARANRLEKVLLTTTADPFEYSMKNLPAIPTVIYEANAGKIGMLGAELARDVTVIYGRALVWKNVEATTRSRPEWDWAVKRQRELSSIFEKLAARLREEANIVKSSIT